MKPLPRKPTKSPTGVIRRGVAYSLRRFSRVTGYREHGLRQLRSLGLRMPYVGRERWILGDDFLDLLKHLEDRGGRNSDTSTEVEGGR